MRFDMVEREELEEEADGDGDGIRRGATTGAWLAFSFKALSRDAWNSCIPITTGETSMSVNSPPFCLVATRHRRSKIPWHNPIPPGVARCVDNTALVPSHMLPR